MQFYEYLYTKQGIKRWFNTSLIESDDIFKTFDSVEVRKTSGATFTVKYGRADIMIAYKFQLFFHSLRNGQRRMWCDRNGNWLQENCV